MKILEGDSELIKHAKQEININNHLFKDQAETGDIIINVLSMLGKRNEGELNLITYVLNKLVQLQPITNLTLEDDEWFEFSDGVFQNKRCPNVFKKNKQYDGKPYCVINYNDYLLEDYPYAYYGILSEDDYE